MKVQSENLFVVYLSRGLKYSIRRPFIVTLEQSTQQNLVSVWIQSVFLVSINTSIITNQERISFSGFSFATFIMIPLCKKK